MPPQQRLLHAKQSGDKIVTSLPDIARTKNRLPSKRPTMHSGSCHCGDIKLTVPSTPAALTSCNCSICRRLGSLWAYYPLGTVKIEGHPEKTETYIWGDKTLRFMRCRNCGCTTHWEPLEPKPGERHGINMRNFDQSLLESVKARPFDGADTWKFLD